jgi:hypothetical protein
MGMQAAADKTVSDSTRHRSRLAHIWGLEFMAPQLRHEKHRGMPNLT